MAKADKGQQSSWELEQALDLSVTFEELINAPPFKESSDEHGRSETVGTRVPTWLLRRIIKLREMKASPYEINSDVLRDAIFLGLRILHLRYKIGKDWSVETKLASIVDSAGASRRIKDQVTGLISGLEDLLQDRDEKHAADRLTDYVLAADELDNAWHKNKIFALLRDSRSVRLVAESCTKGIKTIIFGKEK